MLSVALTENAELRALEPWNAAEFAEHVASARDYLRTWLPWADRIVDTEAAQVLLQSYADQQARGEGRIYGIWADGKLVGGTLFRTFDQRFGNCEVGVWLAPEAVGQGLVTRAVRLMIDWAVGERGMSRVVWQAGATNTRSLATAERIGFTREGVHREEFPHNGVRHDMVVYSILADEWRSLRRGNGGVVDVRGDAGAAVAQGE